MIEQLESYRPKIRERLELILSNLVMIGEVPAPTFHETNRSSVIAERLSINPNVTVNIDNLGNVICFYPGKKKTNDILINAHIDSPLSASVDHGIEISQEHVIGASLGDNTLGCAILASLPMLLDHLGISLNKNLVLVGSTQSLGSGSNKGIREVLKNLKEFDNAILLEGGPQGRMSYNSIGALRLEILVEVPDSYDWSRLQAEGSIDTVIEIVRRIQGIPLPSRPKSSIVFGSIRGGLGFSKIAKRSKLMLEVKSESASIVRDLRQKIRDIVDEEEAKTRLNITITEINRRFPGGLQFSDPLIKTVRGLFKDFGISTIDVPSTSDLSVFIEKKIPAVLIGLTNYEFISDERDKIAIEPLETSLLILLGIILELDKDKENVN